MLVDTHAHLDFTDDKEGWLVRAKEAGVGKIICVGTSLEASRKCMEIADKYSSDDLQIYATVGIHAQDGKGDMEKYGSVEECMEILKYTVPCDPKGSKVQNDNVRKVVGVGETGFDFYNVTSDTEKKFQRELFGAQIELAAELKLPLVVHCRNAWGETFDILERSRNESSTVRSSTLRLGLEELRPNRFGMTDGGLWGVFHSWTGDWEAAKKALSLGFYISFSGIVTFGNAPNVQEVARKMPIARMLLETDSPFLAPHPLRGSKNEPKNVKLVAEFIAQLRNFPLEKIMSVTSENAGRLFEI